MLNTEQFSKLYAETAAQNGVELKAKEARAQVDTFLETVIEAAKNHGGVDFARYFGIEVKETSERKGRNPQSGEEITIPAGKKTSLKRNKFLKEAIQ